MGEFSPNFEQYLQGIERHENPPPPDLPPPVARSVGRPAKIVRRQRIRKILCVIPDCEHEVRRSAKFPLCTDHLLRVWNHVDHSSLPALEEIDGTEGFRFAPPIVTPEEQEARRLARRQKQREVAAKQGTLYVLDTRAGMVKIGFTSRNLWDRVAEYPPMFRLIVSVPGTMADERDVHRSLRTSRAETQGHEWYSVTPEVVRQINHWIAEANVRQMQRASRAEERSAEIRAEGLPVPPRLTIPPRLLPRFTSLDDWEDPDNELHPEAPVFYRS